MTDTDDARVDRLPHGSRVESIGGLPITGYDPNGNIALEARWNGRELDRMRLALPGRGTITVSPKAGSDPLLGVVDQLSLVTGQPLAGIRAVSWAAPDHIPPVNVPGALPTGAGTAILNVIAQLARAAGHSPLRYRGPYPTGALFDALSECFAVRGDPAEAFACFNRDVEYSARHGRFVEPEVDFYPAPFERRWSPDGSVCAQLRDGVEKLYVEGRGYARNAAGARRLRAEGSDWLATVELGGRLWATVARVSAAGELLEGPIPPPPAANEFTGRELPASIRAALVRSLPARAPELLRDALARVLESIPIAFGDAGLDAATVRADRIIVHAALPSLLAAADPSELLEALGRAVEQPAQRVAKRVLEKAWQQQVEGK